MMIIEDLKHSNEIIHRIDQAQLPETFLYDVLVDKEQKFKTDYVTIEIQDGADVAAPFIVPRIDGVPVERRGYELKRIQPVTIGGKRTLTIDDAEQRQYGEDLHTTLTPEQRQGAMIMKDVFELKNMNKLRREAMVANVIQKNAINWSEVIDENGKRGPDMEMRFYKGKNNPSEFPIAQNWDTSEAGGKQLLNDIYKMSDDLINRGLEATMLIVSPDVAQVIVQNEYLLKLLDNKRYELGDMDTKYDTKYKSVRRIGRINAYGADVEIYSYGGSYTEPFTKERKTYLEKGTAIVTSPGVLNTGFGRITQMESDEKLHDYFEVDVPRYLANIKDSSRTVSMKSRPIPYPKFVTPFKVAKVITD